MQYNELGQSGIKVSELCLGTMTWGSQNSQEDANRQINISLENGINFLDTAEMYPATPRSSKTQGDTERIIGNWLTSNNRRSDIILATKITGKGFNSIRNGSAISVSNLRTALEGSLSRLQTDYIDLYQLHWANRGSYHFRQNWNYNPFNQDTNQELDDIFEILNELNKLVEQGKIRAIGLSNETAWGVTQFSRISKENNFPPIVTIQNEYSLMCRHFDLDLAEACHHEGIGLLSFSPLACGILSGKYLNKKIPQGSRKSIYKDLGNRNNKQSEIAASEYISIAKEHNIDPCQMALSFCLNRPSMTSVIFGSTNEKQLINCINSTKLKFSNELNNSLNNVYKKFPIPF